MAQVTAPLTRDGALLAVQVAVSPMPRRREGLPAAKPIAAQALLDTGASHTLIDGSLVSLLQLGSAGIVRLTTPSTGAGHIFASQYLVQLSIEGSQGPGNALQFLNLRVSQANLYPANPFHVLLGRDVLAHCVLIHNGPNRSFTLTF